MSKITDDLVREWEEAQGMPKLGKIHMHMQASPAIEKSVRRGTAETGMIMTVVPDMGAFCETKCAHCDKDALAGQVVASVSRSDPWIGTYTVFLHAHCLVALAEVAPLYAEQADEVFQNRLKGLLYEHTEPDRTEAAVRTHPCDHACGD